MKKPTWRAARYALMAGLALVAAAALATFGAVGTSALPGASQAQYPPKKVVICHHVFRKRGTKHVTIRVSRSSLKAHFKHGDTLGSCSTKRNKRIHSSRAHVKRWHHKAKARK